MSSSRSLIVNADDFGRVASVNRGIIHGFERGIVTSASLMVRWPDAAQAAAYANVAPTLSLGLHFDFGEWTFRDGQWHSLYHVVDLEDAKAVRREATRQLDLFQRLVRSNPTHLDSHQHAHRREPIRSVLRDLANQLGVPLRHESGQVTYCGDFYGQDSDGTSLADRLTTAHLISILTSLSPGTTELCCHPGEAELWDTMYCRQRAQEVIVLCDPLVREAIERLEIRLCSFHSLPACAPDALTRQKVSQWK